MSDSGWELAPGTSAVLAVLTSNPQDEPLIAEIGRASGGYAIRGEDGSIYIPIIAMVPRGQGKGGAFLDALPTDETIKIPAVISPILEGMLERRGFHVEEEWSAEHGEFVEVYVRDKQRKDSNDA